MTLYNIIVGFSCTFAVIFYAVGIYKESKKSMRDLNDRYLRRARERAHDLKIEQQQPQPDQAH